MHIFVFFLTLPWLISWFQPLWPVLTILSQLVANIGPSGLNLIQSPTAIAKKTTTTEEVLLRRVQTEHISSSGVGCTAVSGSGSPHRQAASLPFVCPRMSNTTPLFLTTGSSWLFLCSAVVPRFLFTGLVLRNFLPGNVWGEFCQTVLSKQYCPEITLSGPRKWRFRDNFSIGVPIGPPMLKLLPPPRCILAT